MKAIPLREAIAMLKAREAERTAEGKRVLASFLRPFANAADSWDVEGLPPADDEMIVLAGKDGEALLTVGDFRRARDLFHALRS